MHPERPYLSHFKPELVPSPCFVVDRQALERNAKILKRVAEESGAKVLLALKGFAYSDSFDILKPYLDGVCASSPHEARLGYEKFGKEVHSFAPAFTEKSFQEFMTLSNHIVFNSLTQWEKFKPTLQSNSKPISAGLRINPEYSEVEVELYDPCAKGSRLGTPRQAINLTQLSEFDGLHFHSLCEQGADVLERTLNVFEKNFSDVLHQMKWLNFGGGHHITQPDYDVDLLIRLLKTWGEKYETQIYIEPGEAAAIHTGALVTTVLDILEYDSPIAILDISATCHMPDILEMPYRPTITNAGQPNEKPYNYSLGGLSCLAGDMIGAYSFDHSLQIGDRLIFEDMSHYTMVKTTNFNGIQLPSIGLWDDEKVEFNLTKSFDYQSYATRIS